MKSFLLNALGVIGSIASIVSLFSDNIVFKSIGIAFVLIYIVVISVFVAKRYFSIKKITARIETEFNNRIQNLSEINRGFFDTLKNEIADVHNCSSIDIGTFEKVIVTCCTSLNNYFDHYLGNKNSVCIKRIKTETILDEDVHEWDIVTFGRSLSTKRHRGIKDYKSCKVKENTDFELILTGAEDYFASPDLNVTVQKYKDNNLIFRNSRKNFLEHYQSTIVVPIRISMEKIDASLKQHMNYSDEQHVFHVLGFLCIDSMQTYEENSIPFASAVEQAIAFADAIYPLLEAYLVAQLPSQEELTTPCS